MEKFKNITTKIFHKVAIIFWTIRYGFRISPFWFSSRIIAYISQELIRISTFFFASVILQKLVDAIAKGNTLITEDIILVIILYFLTNLLNSLFSSFDAYSSQVYNFQFAQKAIPMFLSKLHRLDMQYHEDPSFKTLTEKIREALSWQVTETIERIMYLTSSLVSTISIFAILTSINPILILAIAIPIVLNFYIENKYGKNIYDIWSWKGEDKKEAVKAYYSFNEASILAEAKIYGFGDYIANKFQSVTKRYTAQVVKNLNKKFMFYFFTNLLENLIFLSIHLWLITQTLAGQFTIQIYSFYLQSMYQIGNNLTAIQSHLSRINEFSRYITDFKDFLNLKEKLVKSKNPIKLSIAAPLIEFRNVSFKYPNSNNYVLKELDFKVEPGQKIALVGENGAGKTTLIKLLARFYDPIEGDIYINGQNLKNLDLESYYKLWGVLFQQFAQYWFSLRENIGLGNIEDVNNKMLIEEAANKAGLQRVIQKLPNGLENMLSTDFKDGKTLSGGEWQKVGIARGLFANPKLIILDEPTSALDALAEQEVFDEIQKISTDTTMIIVSHRFATVRNADKILVLENGQISEQGSHEELMLLQGLYYKMFTTQAEGYK